MKLFAPIESFLFSYPKSFLFLLLYFMPASMPAFVLAALPVLVFCLASFTFLLSFHISALISCPKSPNILLFCHLLTLISCLKFSIVILFYHAPIFISYLRSFNVLLSHGVLTFISCFGSHVVLMSYYMPASIFCLKSPTILFFCLEPALAGSTVLFLPCHTSISYYGILAFLLLLFVLSSSLALRSSSLGIFKQFLSNKPWPYELTSFAKLFCLFSTLCAYNLNDNNNLYNLTNNKKYKRGFDPTLINSRLLAGNHD